MARSPGTTTRNRLIGLVAAVALLVAMIASTKFLTPAELAEALPGVPHQRRRFHHLREAARPIYEADRHAKVAPKKHVRGARPIERSPEGVPAAG